MLYSIRMRSAKGGAHENGGHHISGAERILSKEELAQTASELVTRALTHSKGCADFIRITIDAIEDDDIVYKPGFRRCHHQSRLRSGRSRSCVPSPRNLRH